MTTSPADSRSREVLLWGMLALASSPILVDLAQHMAQHWWALYCVVFWALFAWEAIRKPAARHPRAAGWLLVAVGVAIELLMVRAAWPRLGRPGVALAMFGMALGLGHPRPALALLALWTVPVPSALAEGLSPHAEHAFLGAAGWLLALVGIPLASLEREQVVVANVGATELEIAPEASGIVLAASCTGLAWWVFVRRGEPWLRVLGALAVAGAAALPLQLAGFLAAGVALAAGSPLPARLLLEVAPWLLVASWLATRCHAARVRCTH